MTSFRYREFAPSAALAPLVRAMWRLTAEDCGPASERVEPIFPDGCVELVFHRADPFAARAPDGALVRQASALFVGPSTSAVHVARGATSDVIGIRFEPGAAAALGLPPLAELRDRIVPLCDLGLRGLDALRDAACDERPGNRFDRIEDALLDRCTERAHGRRLADLVRAHATIAAAASASGRSTRQFERTFVRDVGFTPRELKSVERFQRALQLIDAGGRRLADVAQIAGYADEPHLCRDFRRFTGTTATAYVAARSPLAAAFSTGG